VTSPLLDHINIQRRMISLRLHQLLFYSALAALGSVGCGQSDGQTTVIGTIAYNGKPVTSGIINFLKQGGRPEGGGISADGSYSFALPPGDYQVRIDSPPPLPEGWKEGQPLPKLPPRQLPEKYASYSTSGLNASVTGNDDPQTIDFTLP
jgi:hypothetical protein